MGRQPTAVISAIARFTCTEHGEIWSATVHCRHEIEDEMRRVADGHGKPYGAECKAVINIDLLDAETMEPVEHRTHHPAVP